MTTGVDFLKYVSDKLLRLQFKQKTVNSYLMWLSRILEYRNVDDPSLVTNEQITQYLESLIKRQNYASRTIHQASAALTTIYNECYSRSYEFDLSKLPKRPNKIPIVLTPHEIIELLNKADNVKLRMILAMMYSTGISLSELVNLRKSDIDFHHQSISVQQEKGKKARKAILSEYLSKQLRLYIKEYKPQKWLFESRVKGVQINNSIIQKGLSRTLKKANINKEITPRNLRYTFVAHLVDQGYPLKSILAHLDMAQEPHTRTYRFYHSIIDKKVDIKQSPLDKILYSDRHQFDTTPLERMLFSFSNDDVKNYLMEAIDCFRAGVYRAAVIFTWTAVMNEIYHKALTHSHNVLNNAIQKHHSNASFVKRIEDFASVVSR